MSFCSGNKLFKGFFKNLYNVKCFKKLNKVKSSNFKHLDKKSFRTKQNSFLVLKIFLKNKIQRNKINKTKYNFTPKLG